MMYEPTNYLVILSGISNGMNNLSQQTSSILPMNDSEKNDFINFIYGQQTQEEFDIWLKNKKS